MASGAISEYFEAQNGNGQACGRKFAAFLAREFPGLRPDLSFSLPMRRVGRKRNEGYAAFSAAKNHFSIRFSDADYAARPKDLMLLHLYFYYIFYLQSVACVYIYIIQII